MAPLKQASSRWAKAPAMAHVFFGFAGMLGALLGCASGALVLGVGACINSWRHYTILALAIVTTLVIQFDSMVKTPDTEEHACSPIKRQPNPAQKDEKVWR